MEMSSNGEATYFIMILLNSSSCEKVFPMKSHYILNLSLWTIYKAPENLESFNSLFGLDKT